MRTRRYAGASMTRQTSATPPLVFVLLLALAVLSAGFHGVYPARGEENLIQCPMTASLDHRLLMEQWALAGDCQRPVRSRVTDRFLGYTCHEQSAHTTACRSFLPGPASRVFDTSRHFRCFEIAVTASEAGIVVNLVREWVAPEPRKCDWDPSINRLAMEVDLDNAQVCTAAMCLPIDRLSVIGKTRLRHLLEKAFREMDSMGETSVRYVTGPTLARRR
jgi:hypothetical protein